LFLSDPTRSDALSIFCRIDQQPRSKNQISDRTRSYKIHLMQDFLHDRIVRSNNILHVSFFQHFIRFRLKDVCKKSCKILKIRTVQQLTEWLVSDVIRSYKFCKQKKHKVICSADLDCSYLIVYDLTLFLLFVKLMKNMLLFQ